MEEEKKDNSSEPRVALSALAIKKMKAGDADKSDIGEYIGLRVTCSKAGTKSFVYRYRSPIDNSLKKITLGAFPVMSLAEARVELMRLKLLRAKGGCPATQLKQEKALDKQRKELPTQVKDELTVKDVVDLYLTNVIEDRIVIDSRTGAKKTVKGARAAKGQHEARRTLYMDVIPVLGQKIAVEVTRKNVIEMVRGIIDRGAQVQAGRVLSELSAAYEYAIGLDYFPDHFANPALLAKASLKQTRIKLTPNKRTRVLSDIELKKVLAWLPQSGFSAHHKAILRLTLWTGCRTGEICAAEWKDFNLNEGTWHLKGTKNGSERYVQLSRQCIEFLKSLPDVGSSYLFTSYRTGKPIAQKTITEAKWLLKGVDRSKNHSFRAEQLWPIDLEDWNPHDLRRTVRTGLSRLGCPSEVAEAVLGHSKKGIEGTYNLHAYEKECAAWLQKWADYMGELNVESIIQLPEKVG